MTAVLEVEGLSVRVGRPGREVLRDVSFSLSPGEWVSLVGESGAGKTTLLFAVAGLLPRVGGTIRYEGRPLHGAALAAYRLRRMGLVFQGLYTVHSLTVRENVLLPAMLAAGGRRPGPEEEARAEAFLRRVGLYEARNALPHTLSHGGRRRLAVARALFLNPPIVLADEPTNDLDRENRAIVLDLFRALRAAGTALLVVSHDEATAREGDRALRLEGGRLHPVVE
ncbi:ATP-binding cassette domain-containing protein [Hydrogenibacillus sp. N12]|uniref:ABC transporter ATP-binding protein n=1 Tax=Hydrogenibacillus sp. N12 TaxID=2866627 RepID=UPI001C7CE818|nr:ATP-binding cassette domain-containing protein [Hydrogenibacillus sp. N12]QZA33075.1 ATP-binding cassette domain-containing protein [Hydrogenibacillus sp. N12]